MCIYLLGRLDKDIVFENHSKSLIFVQILQGSFFLGKILGHFVKPKQTLRFDRKIQLWNLTVFSRENSLVTL